MLVFWQAVERDTQMIIRKSIVVTSVLACSFLAGCSGLASEDIAEVRSLLEELDLVEPQPGVPVVEQPTEEEPVVVEQPTEEEPVVVEQPTEEEPVVVEEPTEEEPVVVEQPPVNNGPTASGVISWQPAGFFEDGSVMTSSEISHYKIVFGHTSNNLDQVQEVSLAGILNFDFTAAAGQQWFVGVQTVSIYGSVSDPSNVIAFNF